MPLGAVQDGGESVSKQRLINGDVLYEKLDKHKVAIYETGNNRSWTYGDGIRFAMERIENAPTIPAIPMDWMDAQIRGYASRLQSTELKALVLVKQMWEREQEAR